MDNIAQNFKESLLANDCKLVYPNHQKMSVRVFAKRIEVRIFAKKFFSLMKKAQDIEQLTPIQKLLHWGQLFLREDGYQFVERLKKDELFIKFFDRNRIEKSLSFLLLKSIRKMAPHIIGCLLKKLKKFI